MNALNSLVKTIWIVMVALVVIGFLIADRYRLTEELAELRQRESALQTQLAQQADQCRTEQNQLEQALASEQAQRAQAESQLAGLQQALDGERTQRVQAEGQVAALQQQLTANQMALAACRTDHSEFQVANANRPPVQAKEEAVATWSEPEKWSNTVILILVALTAAALAVLTLVIIRQVRQRSPEPRRNRPAGHTTQPNLQPLRLQRRSRADNRKKA